MGNNADDVTTIKVKGETWKRLNQLKEPGDSFDEVIQKLLKEDAEEGSEGNANPPLTKTAN
jgi:predicted CopG family antitoxin